MVGRPRRNLILLACAPPMLGLLMLLVASSGWLLAAPPFSDEGNPTSTSEPVEPVDEIAILRAVRRLSNPDFDVRQRATEELWRLGPAAAPILERLLEERDAETRLRGKSILDRFKFGILIDTPPEQVALIKQFRYGQSGERVEAFKELAETGDVETLFQLSRMLTEPADRLESQLALIKRLEADGRTELLVTSIFDWLEVHKSDVADRNAKHLVANLRSALQRQIPLLLASESSDLVGRILEDATITDVGKRHLAVFLQLTDQAQSRIAEMEEVEETTEEEKQLLFYLYRARGEMERARDIAASMEDPLNAYHRGILFEMGDWKSLSDLHQELLMKDPFGSGRSIEALGYSAAFHRLAGETERYELAVEGIKGLVKIQLRWDMHCAEALIVNGRLDEGIDMLKPRRPASAFRMYAIQNRFEDAFALAGLDYPSAKDATEWFEKASSKAASGSEAGIRQFELAVEVGRLLFQLGKREEARQGFRRLATTVWNGPRGSQLLKVCEAEQKAGLREEALAHAARVLALKGDPLSTVFPGNTELARVWKDYWTKQPVLLGQSELLEKVDRVLDRRSSFPETEFLELCTSVTEAAEGLTDKERGTWYKALADTCALRGLEDAASRYLLEAAQFNAAASLELGDRARQDEDWEQAAQHYELAHTLDPRDHLSRYLHGESLVRLGQVEAGEQLQEIARLGPIANANERKTLAAGLDARDLEEVAAPHWALILQTGPLRVSHTNRFSDTAVFSASQKKGNMIEGDRFAKADLWESMHLTCLEYQLWIPSFQGYFQTPHLIHSTRAREYVTREDFNRAWEEIQTARLFMPGNSELSEQLVPQLEEAGRRDLADKLFDASFEFMHRICEDFPESPLHLNNLAWMSARCDRKLDVALQLSQRSLELAPDTATYLDTLGEVHFRRGEFPDAIRCAKQCLELDPNNDFYAEQLERFEKAQVAADES